MPKLICQDHPLWHQPPATCPDCLWSGANSNLDRGTVSMARQAMNAAVDAVPQAHKLAVEREEGRGGIWNAIRLARGVMEEVDEKQGSKR